MRTPFAGSTWAKAVLGKEVYLDPPAYAAGAPGRGKMGNFKDYLQAMVQQEGQSRG